MTVPRLLPALLASLAVVLGLAPPPPAAAAEPQALVQIALTSLDPALPARDGTVEVRGQVTNVSDQRLYRLQAIVWRDQAPITTDEGLDQALASEANVPIGARQVNYYDDLYTTAEPYLLPQQSATFQLRVPVRALELAATDGIYLLGVHVLANGNPIAIGRTRVFVPVVDAPPPDRLQITSLVVLSSRPSLLRRGVLADEHLADEVRPGGRLAALLDAADRPDVSFAVDPALVEELTTMRGDYAVQADGATTPGRGQADAAAWLQRLQDLIAGRDAFQLLYGSPDVAALVHDGHAAVLDDALAAGRRVSATADLPLLVLPGAGYADQATLDAAAGLDPAAVVLSDASAVADAPLLRGPDGVPVVRYSDDSLGGGPGPEPRSTPVQLRQRVLAETWLDATARTRVPTQGQVRLVTSSSQVEDSDAGVEAPWMSRTTLGDLLARTPARWDGELLYPEEAAAAELTAGQLRTLRRLATSTAAFREVLVNPEQAGAGGQAAVARAASVAWRKQERLRSPYLEAQQAALDATLVEGLRISTNPKVSTVAREGVEFPITIQNRLPADESDPDVNAVRLQLVFVSENRQRLTIKPIEAPLIRAGENFTANAKVTAKANGTVPVTAQLQTLSGIPVGRPQTIEVRVTQNGTTGWAIAAAALVLFGGGTALRIRQVGRSRSIAVPAGTPAPSALTSAPPTAAPERSRPGPPPPDGRA